ncbi:Plastocyanin-like domain [Musa troglodytarum]|uniref:Plastocyanin-like domain n=1 Tax=Musa troglodytarum TaxID=320322 RepID=A0A9E7GE31_9LILI|nr:Plastocyanin-like domain [Musa troglodytarum]
MVKVMATAMALVLAFLLAAGVGFSEGAVYKVGDAAGWTIMGSPNYTAWALSKKFEVGDTIVFEYNKSFHDVLEVSKADYRSCNAASPIATFATGNDSITIKTTGHHYFICGIPGHCGGGQKVDIKISKSASSAAPSTSPTASPSASPATSAPAGARGGISIPAAAPGANSGTRALPGLIALALSVLASAAVSGGLAMNY